VTTALERTETDADPEYAVASAPGYRFVQTALQSIDAERLSTFNDVGYAGTATLLLDIAHALESTDPGTLSSLSRTDRAVRTRFVSLSPMRPMNGPGFRFRTRSKRRSMYHT